MNIWALVAVFALLIPILAILLDSQVGRALADRLEGEPESEVRYLSETIEDLREERRRLDDGE